MNKIAKPRRVRIGEEGEMGVGTLLIFIAMILVAAVAAGVLVQTAYKLQQQAEATGDLAVQEVATGLRVITVYGVTAADHSVVTDLYVKVALSAGSPVINMYNVIVEISTGYADISLDHVNLGATDGTFNATQIRDTYPYNDWTVSATDQGITQGDLVLLHIDLANQTTDMSLVTQQEVSVLIIPKHGIPTYVDFMTPSVLSDDYEQMC
jgi:flagellin FlaB